MLKIALAFLCGNLWVQLLPGLFVEPVSVESLSVESPSVQSLALPAATALSCLLLSLWPASRSKFSSAAIVAFLCGLVWTAWQAHGQLQQDLAPALEGQDLVVTGHIASIPQVESYGVRFAFEIQPEVRSLPRTVELTWYRPPIALHAAERWQLTVRLKRRHGFANPGGYDYEAQLFRQGIGATGYIRTSDANQRLGVMAGERILKLRARLTEAIARALPDAPMQGVIRGLAVGDQQAIDSEAWSVFARTGTSHLMAISGFHIGMVAWLFAWLGAQLLRWPGAQRWRWTRPDLRAVFGMSAALAYSLLAGMSVPTQRTLIMLAIYFGSGLLRREVNIWHSYGLALLLVLVIDPFAPLAIGAWLSFGAVAVILLNQVGRIGKASTGWAFLNIQAVVSVGLVPLLLSSFGGLSLVSPWVNLIAIPLFTAVMVPAVLAGCVLLWLNTSLGTAWLQGVAHALNVTYQGLQWAADLPWASVHVAQAAPWALALLLVGTVMMILPWAWPLRVSGLLWCVPALSWQVATPPPGGFELTALDVGQGLAVVVRTHRRVLLYDTGPSFQSGRDTGELVVLPYLRAQGIRTIDMLMVSHGDDDHAGGLHTVLAGMHTQRLSLGPSVPILPKAETCQRGQQWQWDEIVFSVLHPGPEHSADNDNNRSCVLSINGANGSALLLGDIDRRIERELVQAQRIDSTVVVAAHHGSAGSSTQELVTAAAAQAVIFSAGYRNRWAFPRADVTARWHAAGTSAFTTANAGAIDAWLVPGQPLRMQTHRQRRRYWQTHETQPDDCRGDCPDD